MFGFLILGMRGWKRFAAGHAGSGPTFELLGGEIVDGDGVLKKGIIAGHDGNSAIGDEVAGAVGFGVIADGGAFGRWTLRSMMQRRTRQWRPTATCEKRMEESTSE